jgi:hypothetical protein
VSRLLRRRWHLWEIHEQPWCPASLRDAVTDTIQFYVSVAKPFAPVEDRLIQAIRDSGATQVIDLCSGAGGPWLDLAPKLRTRDGQPIKVILTDLHPNRAAFRRVAVPGCANIEPYPHPVDARSVPPELKGFRTLFTSFHHFRPEDARQILEDALENGDGIAVLEAQDRSLRALLFFLIYLPLTFLAVPFIRPLRWPRLFWTYFVPVLPLVITHDALVSCLRTYEAADLCRLQLARHLIIGETALRPLPLCLTYLIAL